MKKKKLNERCRGALEWIHVPTRLHVPLQERLRERTAGTGPWHKTQLLGKYVSDSS